MGGGGARARGPARSPSVYVHLCLFEFLYRAPETTLQTAWGRGRGDGMPLYPGGSLLGGRDGPNPRSAGRDPSNAPPSAAQTFSGGVALVGAGLGAP